MYTASDTDSPGLIVRDCAEADIRAIQAIYAHEVLHGVATFERVPPSVEELASRWRGVLDLGLPYLTAEADGRVVGYAYASSYRSRPAYRYTVEDSIYVAEGFQGRGVGRALLAALIARCEEGPWRQMIAIASAPEGGSVALHERFGFSHVGVFKAVGFKHGKWIDTVLMQRPLGPGSTELPVSLLDDENGGV